MSSTLPGDLAKLERETHEKMRKLAEVRSAVAAECHMTAEVRYIVVFLYSILKLSILVGHYI